jgi:signal peptidase I
MSIVTQASLAPAKPRVLTRLDLPPRPDVAPVPAVRRRSLPIPLRFVRTLISWAALGMASVLLVLLTIPMLFGFHNFIEMSGSMEPTVHVGDVVIDRSISPLDVRVGDVITFRDPQDQSKLITHRVHDIHVRAGYVRFTTKGDAINSVQKWNIPVTGHVGRVVTRIRGLGFALYWVSMRIGRLLLIAIPAVSLGLMEILKIWRPKRKKVARAPAS